MGGLLTLVDKAKGGDVHAARTVLESICETRLPKGQGDISVQVITGVPERIDDAPRRLRVTTADDLA